MAIGRRSRGRSTRSGPGAPRSPRREVSTQPRRARIIWMLAGALALGVPVGAATLARATLDSREIDRVAAARAQVVSGLTEQVDAALEPLGRGPAPRLLYAPADLADALEVAQNDAAVVKAAAIGEALIPLIERARGALAAIDVPSAVRDRGLDQGLVVTLIDARSRMLDALDLYRSAAQLAAESALLEGSSLEAVLDTARDLTAKAAVLFEEGHELLVDAQISAGTYSGPLVPAGGLG